MDECRDGQGETQGSGLPWHPSMHMTIMVWGSICVNGEKCGFSGKRFFLVQSRFTFKKSGAGFLKPLLDNWPT